MPERHSFDAWREVLRDRDDRLTLEELNAALLLDQCAYLRQLSEQTAEAGSRLRSLDAHLNRLNNGRAHNLEVWLVLLSRWLRALLGQVVGGPQVPLYPETTHNRPEYDEVRSLLADTWERQDAVISQAQAALDNSPVQAVSQRGPF